MFVLAVVFLLVLVLGALAFTDLVEQWTGKGTAAVRRLLRRSGPNTP